MFHAQSPDGGIDSTPGDSALDQRPTFDASYKQGCVSNADCANELTCINNICDCCQKFGDDALGPFACDAALNYHQNCPPQLVCVRDNFADQCMCCDDTGDTMTCSTSEAFANAHCLIR